MSQYYVYILTNTSHSVLYIGITSDLEKRIWQHRNNYYVSSFSSKYSTNKLIYFETHDNPNSAIEREKQIKKWKREWKINLIEASNHLWIDLASGWDI